MGKFKGKNFQGTDERKSSKMNKPKGTVNRDNFFMKPKIKQSKSFEGGQMKNSKDNFFIKRKGMNKTKSFKIEQTNNDDNFFLTKTSEETKSSEVEQIEKTQNYHTDERKSSKMNKPKGTVDRDNFFMKPKIKQSKSFEGGQMKNSKDNFVTKRKGINKTKSFKIEQTNNDDNFLAKTSDETKSSEVEQIEKTQNDHTDLKEEKIKIPFDKRKWRLQKYSNKYKVDKWKEMREKKILNQYQKFTKKQDDKGLDIQKIYEKYDQENSGDEMDPVNFLDGKAATSNEKGDGNDELISEDIRSKRKSGPLTRKDKLQEIKEEKERKRQEYLKKKEEKEEALRLSRKKKAERYKRLNKRTKKGQPIMKDRMEMLFEQVQKMCQE